LIEIGGGARGVVALPGRYAAEKEERFWRVFETARRDCGGDRTRATGANGLTHAVEDFNFRRMHAMYYII
jgi:hypothetical protein